MFFGVWVFLAEAAWIIYGNTFIYSDEIRDCEETLEITFGNGTVNVQKERTTALVLIIYGYFLLLAIVVAIFLGIGFYFAYKSYTENDKAIVNNARS